MTMGFAVRGNTGGGLTDVGDAKGNKVLNRAPCFDTVPYVEV